MFRRTGVSGHKSDPLPTSWCVESHASRGPGCIHDDRQARNDAQEKSLGRSKVFGSEFANPPCLSLKSHHNSRLTSYVKKSF